MAFRRGPGSRRPLYVPFCLQCASPSNHQTTCLLCLADGVIVAKTKFIQDEVVGVINAVDGWSGKGEVAPQIEADQPVPRKERASDYGSWIDRTWWSQTYQWLPANLAFQDDGTLRFTSYINNLHPKKHPEMYRLVERLVNIASPLGSESSLTTPPLTNPASPRSASTCLQLSSSKVPFSMRMNCQQRRALSDPRLLVKLGRMSTGRNSTPRS